MNDNQSDENKSDADKNNETENQERRRRAAALSHQVRALMDELKSIYQPQMRLTFIARDPNDPASYTLLTEEPDFMEFLKWLNTAQKTIQDSAGPTPSDAIN